MIFLYSASSVPAWNQLNLFSIYIYTHIYICNIVFISFQLAILLITHTICIDKSLSEVEDWPWLISSYFVDLSLKWPVSFHMYQIKKICFVWFLPQYNVWEWIDKFKNCCTNLRHEGVEYSFKLNADDSFQWIDDMVLVKRWVVNAEEANYTPISHGLANEICCNRVNFYSPCKLDTKTLRGHCFAG